jgi:hypothetical protein
METALLTYTQQLSDLPSLLQLCENMEAEPISQELQTVKERTQIQTITLACFIALHRM